ncbi:hypothetical protein PTT_01418 [Pyrenophora teres f. teres 0-1]|uniref:Chromo domain-containing protein n=1 Tax=Pyrenophora teres f. teres (strain 0-1) TaxID=861557 RepID=E3RD17_PYRTT|nr:hypothetical protein PTT_01418 [Pyrenophora teres f. teres 0-1]
MTNTNIVREGNSEISGSGGGEDGDVGSYDDFAPQNESEGEEFRRNFREGTEDGSSNQPVPSENISQENTVVIEDSQPSSDTDEGDSHENDAGTQIGDRLEVSSITAPDRRGGECPIDTEDVIDSDAVGKAKTQMSWLPRRKFLSTQPMSSSKMNIEQPTQGRTPTIENTSSSSSSDTDDDRTDDRGNQTAWLTRKRKRFPPTKQHILSSNTTSKQRLKHNVRSAKQRRLSPSGGRPFSNRALALKPLSAPPYSGYDAKICYSDDSRNDSSDDSSGNRVRHLESIKRPMSTVRPYRPRKHKRKRSQGTADEDDEYEVEKILNARVYRKKLQYRVQWLGYEEDPEWYDASNFKNSPHRLRDFHTANPLHPGPPRRLEMWVQCWEEDRDAGNHPDDDKPEEPNK